QSYEPINGNSWEAASSSYTVGDGDTLQSIAAAMWGDAALWYLIADANGLTASSELAAGQTIAIPNKNRQRPQRCRHRQALIAAPNTIKHPVACMLRRPGRRSEPWGLVHASLLIL
ncbi:MAG TPA: LysM domain-containing protein, partial [Rhizomicrobium sp.]